MCRKKSVLWCWYRQIGTRYGIVKENSKSIIFAVISARHTKNLALYMAINHDSFISNWKENEKKTAWNLVERTEMQFFIAVKNAISFLEWSQSFRCYAYLVENREKSFCANLDNSHTFNLTPWKSKGFPAYKSYWFSSKWDTKYETYCT